jgi:hypothetical protein
MIAIIAVLCSLSSPANCHEQTVTTSDFADVSMQSCLMGAPQLADWMNQHPTCGFRGLRPGIPIERDHAVRSNAATCSDEGGRGVVAGMRSWVRFSWLRQEWRAAQ